MHAHKILNIPTVNVALEQLLCRELGVSKILAQLLINRGITDPQGADEFLNPGFNCLGNPFDFSDMHKAAAAIKQAVCERKRIMVFGDYDVDGVTALALVTSTLVGMGADIIPHLPHRIADGYGLSKNILKLAKDASAALVITVDCGTNSYHEIKTLRAAGVEVIVTDHHEPAPGGVEPALAVINPKLSNCRYPYRDLAGVGVAYKLCQALTGKNLLENLDLVALGTIADVVPLTGENRFFVKEGLSRISHTQRPGLQALLELSGIKDKPITSTFVSYILGPRINASGRIDSAETSLHLLLSKNLEEARDLAKVIEGYNRKRQQIESRVLEEAQDLIDREINFKEHKIIVIAKEGWHTGVIGIVASKLADRFYRPTILISLTGGLCRGSGRSIKNFHLFASLAECRELLQAFGGHSHAVGLAITEENIGRFKNKINRLAQEKLRLEDLLPTIDIDKELTLQELADGGIAQIERLEPFGAGNPEPLFYTRGLAIKGQLQILSRETLKCWVTDGVSTYPAIGFGMGYLKDTLTLAQGFGLVYTPRIDSWAGEGSVILEIKDIFI